MWQGWGMCQGVEHVAGGGGGGMWQEVGLGACDVTRTGAYSWGRVLGMWQGMRACGRGWGHVTRAGAYSWGRGGPVPLDLQNMSNVKK